MPAGNTQVVAKVINIQSSDHDRNTLHGHFKRRLRLVYIECESKTSGLYLELDLAMRRMTKYAIHWHCMWQECTQFSTEIKA